MTDKNGGAAFPGRPQQDPNDVNKVIHNNGMSLRDYFAIHAAWEDVRHYSTNENGFNISRTKARYKYADAMLAARDK